MQLRTLLRLILLALWLLFAVAIAAGLHLFKLKPLKRRWVRVGFAGCCRIIGLRVEVQGKLAKERPLLLITNHLSYLDVFTLGSQFPVRFAPKAEVAGWPIIGTICRVIGCVFITRKASATRQASSALHAALAEGDAVCLFPEGTTSDGKRLLPFKSSLLTVEPEVFVQPARIRYMSVNGLPVDTALLPKLAWYGDMQLWPHLKEVLRFARIDAQVSLFSPMHGVTDRKELAKTCERMLLR